MAEQDANAFPTISDGDATAAAIPAAPQPRQDVQRAPEGRGKVDPAPADEGAVTGTPMRGASGGEERRTAGDGERPPAQPDRPVIAREGRPAPQAPAPTATTSAGEAGREPERLRPAGGMAAPPSPRADADGGPARMPVSVLGFSTSSAPVMPPAVVVAQLSTTAAGVVAAIEAEPAWRAAAAEAALSQRAQTPAQAHATVSSLRIQLNPAELGMVTARLVASGSQLEVEIRVESNDARQRLANDADAIVRALRGVGYEVERVTIQQAPQAGSAGQQHGAAGRDPLAQQDQQPRDGAGANAGGRNGRQEADNGGTARHHAGETAAQRSGGGVYI
jgi:chemotaxis protein MotD